MPLELWQAQNINHLAWKLVLPRVFDHSYEK